jgi:transposase
MARPLVTEELWQILRPLLPPARPRRRRRHARGGRPPLDDRKVLAGVVFVLRTGVPWEYLPREMGCGCGMTCWRRLRDWHEAGVWHKLHRVLLDRLNAADKIDWSRAVVDSTSVRAMHGGKKRERVPWTAEKRGPNTTCWLTAPAGCRWPSRSPAPTATT